MLRVEIDGGGSDAPAILGRSAHPFGEIRPGPAAAGAGVDEAVMLGDLDQPLRQIENLTPLEAPRHCPGQERAATAAGRRLMRHDPVGFGCLAKGLALVAFLPAARPTLRLAKAHRFLSQTVTRRRFRTRRTVQPEPASKLRVLSPQRLQLPLKRRDQGRNLRRNTQFLNRIIFR